MLINLYNQLFVMSIVAGGLYLILKLLSAATIKYFTASWHYYTYTVIYLFLLLPYHKLISLFHLIFSQRTGNDLAFPALPSIVRIPTYDTNDVAVADKTSLNIDFLPYLLIAGTIVFILVILVQNYKLHHSILSACRLTDKTQTLEILSRCKQKMGISQKMLLYISPYASTPFLYGILKPRIVLPEAKFTEKELEGMFCHELTHWKRHDGLLKCLMLFINALHWYNPLAYIARRDIDRFCELSCDETLATKMSQEERREYCELLLSVLQNVKVQDAKLYSAFSDKQQLERRINIIMEIDDLKSKKWARLIAATMTLTFLLVGAVTAYAASDIDIYNKSSVEDVAIIETDAVFFDYVEEAISENEDVRLIEDNSVSLVEEESTIISPMASGALAAGKAYGFDNQYLAKGQTVTINAEWTPAESDIRIGLMSSSGTVTAITVSDGEGSVSYEIKTSGYYYIYVGNPSSSTVNFNVSYIVN